MARLGYVATIPYQGEKFEVTGVEFCEWEDTLRDYKTDEEQENFTYEFLLENGYFVSRPKPKSERHGIRDVTEETENETKPAPVRTANNREKDWTPSKILAEKKKLLIEREKILKLKEDTFNKKVLQAAKAAKAVASQQKAKRVQSNEDESSPAEDLVYTVVGIGAVIFLIVLFKTVVLS